MKTIVFFFYGILPLFLFSQNHPTRVYFDSDQARTALKLEYIFNQIDSNAQVQIYAYTDTVGTLEYNLTLSKKRAEFIAEQLKKYNSTVVLEVKALGETNSESELGKNRRVDISWQAEVVEVEEIPVEKSIPIRINLNVQFVNGTADILPQSFPEIKALLERLDTMEYHRIELHGHVCCGPEYHLSISRARTVRDVLINHGIRDSIISTFGHSNEQPAYPETSLANEAKNRRVEVFVFKD